jgi:mRNA interferase MazF
VWLVVFGAARPGELGKNRPAIVVTADSLSTGSVADLIVVVPLSSSSAPSMLRPAVHGVEGVDRPSCAIPRSVEGVARSRLLRRLGTLPPEKLAEIERALALILGLAPGSSRPRQSRKRRVG